MDYLTDTSNLDINSSYGSAGNVFANTLQSYYLSYTAVSIDIDVGSDDLTEAYLIL